MAHKHNDDCRRLNGIVETLVAREGIPAMQWVMAGAGADVGLLPYDAPSHPESDGSDDGNLELEIASARRALEVMGCSR